MDETEELKERKKRTRLDVDCLVKSVGDMSEKAEEPGQLTLVSKSNALRKAAKDRTLRLQELTEKLKGNEEALNGC